MVVGRVVVVVLVVVVFVVVVASPNVVLVVVGVVVAFVLVVGTTGSILRRTYCRRTTKEAPTLVSSVTRSPSISMTYPTMPPAVSTSSPTS